MTEDAVHGGNLLCIANFSSDTGYAWSYIRRLYAGLADRLSPAGVTTWAAYPEIRSVPADLRDSAVRPVEMDVELSSASSLVELSRFCRSHEVRVVYLSDLPGWHPSYLLLRAAGVERIVVHDHASGERTPPTGPKRVLKLARRELTGALADRVVAVSDFVAERLRTVALIPEERIVRIWNALPPVNGASAGEGRSLRRELGVGPRRPLIVVACRATREKGIHVLLRAFDRMSPETETERRPALVYMGDGPYMEPLRAMRRHLEAAEDVHFTGYVEGAARYFGEADVAVVPSIWQEAFGLAALEPMARGTPVVASRVGGLPEVVEHGESGLLVPPGDAGALAEALEHLLRHPEERRRLGRNGEERARTTFDFSRMLDHLVETVWSAPVRAL